MEVHFLNLTNGLEWDIPNAQYIRIESTAIEHDDTWRILRDLDANFLLHLSLGHICHVYDCGTNREVSKTISVGLPLIEKWLYKFWTGEKIPLLTDIQRECGRKIKYFRRYFTGKIHLIGHSKSTCHDGDVEFYKKALENHEQRRN